MSNLSMIDPDELRALYEKAAAFDALEAFCRRGDSTGTRIHYISDVLGAECWMVERGKPVETLDEAINAAVAAAGGKRAT